MYENTSGWLDAQEQIAWEKAVNQHKASLRRYSVPKLEALITQHRQRQSWSLRLSIICGLTREHSRVFAAKRLLLARRIINGEKF